MNSVIIEVLAAILILISLVKIVMLLVNPQAWFGFIRRFYADTRVISGMSLTLAGIVLYLLIRSGLDIVKMLAVFLLLFLSASIKAFYASDKKAYHQVFLS